MKLALVPSSEDIVALRQQSSVVTLAARGYLDADQVHAAFKFQNAFLVAIEAKRESIGFNEWQQPHKPQALMELRTTASKELKQARDLLGSHGYMLVGRVCGEGFHLLDMYPDRRERDAMIWMLKIHLHSLAKLWRLS